MLESIEYVLPVYWASYLINRDESGYSPDELVLIRQWESDARVGEAISCDEDSYFTRYCDAAPALDMCLVECTNFQFPV